MTGVMVLKPPAWTGEDVDALVAMLKAAGRRPVGTDLAAALEWLDERNRLLPPALGLVKRSRLVLPNKPTLKCDLAEAQLLARHVGGTVQRSWLTAHEGGRVALGEWTDL